MRRYIFSTLFVIFLAALFVVAFVLKKENSLDVDINHNYTGLAKKIVDSNKVGTYAIWGNVAIDKSESGLYAYPESDGTSYYFRGNRLYVNNNLVFAGFQWKIIRIDLDGNIKLLYNGIWDGTINDLEKDINCGNEGHAECLTSIQNSTFNLIFGNSKYIGYTYDYGVSSAIKEVLEEWYVDNLLQYDDLIADAVYCNDLDMANMTDLRVYRRLGVDFKPGLDCSLEDYSYTKDKINGNGKLSQKIGLITADEVSLAGGRLLVLNQNYYLYNGTTYWTMSPYYQLDNKAYMFYVAPNGALAYEQAGYPNGVRPVIALKSEALLAGGNGSINNPYMIK